MSSTDVLTVVNAAAAALRPFRVPLIADGDTGFGDIYNLKRTVKSFARAGAAGIMLEDQVSTGAYQICKLLNQHIISPQDHSPYVWAHYITACKPH